MKKILLAVTGIAAAIMLCACGGSGGGLFADPTPTPVPEIDPSAMLTAEDVALATGYQPVLDGGAITRDGNRASALYLSDPVGQGDPVEISIVQYTDTITADEVWNEYATAKSLRPSEEEVTDLGENAYIAFPSINIYDRGCYIKITAGSGNDDNQRNQLLTIARTAIAKFETMMSPPVTTDNAVEQK